MNPKERSIVFFTEFTARFCMWTIVSQLLVHLLAIHWKTSSQQLYIIGAVLSLSFISTILGGIFKDWFISGKQVVMLGISLVALGNSLFLFFPNSFYASLSLILLGTGMVTSNTPILLSQLPDGNHDKNFTILYGFTNAGVIFGSVLGGIFFEHYTWHIMLFLNELVLLLWFLQVFFSIWRREWRFITTFKFIKILILLLIVETIAFYYLKMEVVSQVLLSIAAITYISFFAWLMVKEKVFRKSLLYIFLLIFVAIIFFSGEFQVASSIVDYANNFVRLNFFDFTIPAGSLLALESIFVILGALIITKVRTLAKFDNEKIKILLGLIMGLLAFTLLSASTYFTETNRISILWIVFTFLLLGFGDVFLMPPIMAYVVKAAPLKYKGRIMAGVYFALSLSGYLSGLIGSVIAKSFLQSDKNILFYHKTFDVMIIIFAILILAIIFFKLSMIIVGQRNQ